MLKSSEERESSGCETCTPFPDNCLEGNACAEGYAGEMCTVCATRYYMFKEKCHECPLIPLGTVGMGVLLLLAAYNFYRTKPVNILQNTSIAWVVALQCTATARILILA